MIPSLHPPRSLCTTFALLLLLIGPAARAQLTFPLQPFEPTASPLNYLATESGRTLPHLSPSAGLYLSYVHRPLVLRDMSDDRVTHDLVRYQVNMDLVLALGLWDRFEIGLGLPVTLLQDDDDLSSLGGDSLSGGLGDLRIIPKARLLRWRGLDLALTAPLSLPTGDGDNFLGADGVSFAPRLVLAYEHQRAAAAVNVGYRLRPDQSVTLAAARSQGKVTIDDQLFFSLGARLNVWRERMDLLADATLAMALDQQDEEELPAELWAGVRFYLPHNLIATAAAGPGLSGGIGTPVFRVIAALTYQYLPSKTAPPRKAEPKDSDGDGLLDRDDSCPSDPEDKDGFEDQDGCPDLDNDKDGLIDTKDRCPNEPEDKDGFEDQDGCPDLDNDKDGLVDTKDRCPGEPEDKDGFQDDDGCPDISKGPVKITRSSITVPAVYFATAKDTILPRSFPVLKEVAKTLKNNEWVKKMRIEGHTDDRGRDAFNMDLSRRRAATVRAFLIKEGVEPGRLESQGFGETRPIASNKTRAGRAKNRRVEFIIVDPAPAGTAPAGSTTPTGSKTSNQEPGGGK